MITDSVPEAPMRSFRPSRSSMSFGRAAFWTTAASYAAALFFTQFALAWFYSIAATLLALTELIVMRNRKRSRHPGMAVVGLLLGIPVVLSPLLLLPARRAMSQARPRANLVANTSPVRSQPNARLPFVPDQHFSSINLTNLDAETTLEVLPRWKEGEKVSFERFKSRRKGQGDKVTPNSTARGDFDIEVLSVKKDAFVVAWTWGRNQLDDPVQNANPAVRKLSNLIEDQRMILELDSQAGIRGVQNWKELQDAGTKTLDILTEELKSARVTPPAIAAIRAQVTPMYANKQQIETFCVREPQLFFLPHGIELKGGKPWEFEDKLLNPLGGEPIPSRASLVLKGVDKDQGLAVFTFHQLAQTNVSKAIGKMLNDMAQRLEKPVPAGDQLAAELTIEDSAEYVLDLSSGWVRSFTHKRHVKSQGQWQEDSIAVTRRTN